MKIRMGFVSNSSSSSFIVVFPKLPTSALDMQEILYPDGEGVASQWDFYEGVSAQDAAETIWKQFSREDYPDDVDKYPWETQIGGPVIDPRTIINAFRAGYMNEDPKYPWDKKQTRESRKAYYRKFNVYRAKIRKEFLDRIKKDSGAVLGIFSFSDNDGGNGAVLETGRTFRNLPHITFNEH